jgi:hypothetical protein
LLRKLRKRPKQCRIDRSHCFLKTEGRPHPRQEKDEMKTKRWMKSVIAAAQSPELAKVSLPWQRGVVRKALVQKRRSAGGLVRSA